MMCLNSENIVDDFAASGSRRMELLLGWPIVQLSQMAREMEARAYGVRCRPSVCLPGFKQLWLGLQLFKNLATPMTVVPAEDRCNHELCYVLSESNRCFENTAFASLK